MKKGIFKLLNLVLAATLVFNSLGVFADDTDNSDKQSDFINDTLETSDSIDEISGFTLTSKIYGPRCGYSGVRDIYVTNANGAYMRFYAGRRDSFGYAEFNVTVNSTKNWIVTQSKFLNEMLEISNDGETWTSVTGGVSEQSGAVTDSAGTWYTHKLYWKLEASARYVRIKSAVSTADFGANNLFIHHARLGGLRNEAELLLDDGIYDISKVTVLKGFKNASAWSNCGTESRTVFYRSGSGDAYAVYNTEGIGSITEAETEITVSASNNSKITGSGQLDDIIYLSADGREYTAAAGLSGYSAEKELKSTQNNHYTYTVSYILPTGYKYIKIDAAKFNDWQMYLTGVRLYGKKTGNETAADEPSGYPNGFLALGDAFETKKLAKPIESAGFSIQRGAGAKTGDTYTKAVAVKTSEGGSDGYLVYGAKNSGGFAYAEIKVSLDGPNEAWRLTDADALGDTFFASEDGTAYTRVSGLKLKHTGTNTDRSQQFANFTIYGELPSGTRYFKVDAGAFGSWLFIVREVMLYADYAEDDFNYNTAESLAELHSDYFGIAAAIEPEELYDYNDLLLSQFNELTIENQMKPSVIHPSEAEYNFEGVDRIVDFAEENGLKVRGHGLFYEKVMPSWFYEDDESGTALKEQFLTRLEAHIKTIVSRYKGRIYCYDVANELFGHNGYDVKFLNSKLGMTNDEIGECICKAYEWAHEADPDAILILNDNYYDILEKRSDIYSKVKAWVENGTPIHGIGFQEHLFIDTTAEAVDETLTLFETVSEDFKLFVTELDLSPYGVLDSTSSYPDFMADEVKEMQAKKYASLFDVYRKHSSRIETVGTWNICDAECWYEESGTKKYYATLFDYEGHPNPAWYGAADIEGKLPRWDGGEMPIAVKKNNYVIDTDTDMLTVYGSCSGTVSAKLTGAFDTEILLDSKELSADGEYKLSLVIDKDGVYTGETSPDYVLEVTEGETVKTDSFTYYKAAQRTAIYTVTDSFSDYSKVYRARNTMLTDDGISYQKIWNTGTFGDGEIVYKIPAGRVPKSISAKMYTKKSDGLCELYGSADDKSWTKLDSDWTRDKLTLYHYSLGISEESLPKTVKYIKIIVPVDKTSNNYLSEFKLYTADAGFELEEAAASRSGNALTVNGSYVNAISENGGEDIYLAVYDKEGRLVASDAQSFGESAALKEFELCAPIIAGVEMSNFEPVSWASARCGYSDGRKVYTAVDNKNAYMIFDAGEAGAFTDGEFSITLHGNQQWMAENSDNIKQRVYVSDDKSSWTAVTDIAYTKEETVRYADGGAYYGYTLSFTAPKSARYIKFSASGATYANHVFMRGAKLSGGAKTLFESDFNITGRTAKVYFWTAGDMKPLTDAFSYNIS